MIKQDQELLLRDLCARLPYGVKISVNNKVESLQGINVLDNVVEYGSFLSSNIEEVKSYLYPLSSMTEEQNKEWLYTLSSDYHITFDTVDWLNQNHFDYRGLIEKGLAIDATNLNIYKTPAPNNPQIIIGTKICLKSNPDEILTIISDDCHEDKFECSDGSVLSLKQIKKYYDIRK